MWTKQSWLRLRQTGAPEASASDHASDCPEHRPASANQPVGPRWPATKGAFSTGVCAAALLVLLLALDAVALARERAWLGSGSGVRIMSSVIIAFGVRVRVRVGVRLARERAVVRQPDVLLEGEQLLVGPLPRGLLGPDGRPPLAPGQGWGWGW
eukprot:scaffold71297_cov39-Phaeocystis_antarctica.AAC.1